MNDRLLAWIFLVIFVLDILALWLITIVVHIQLPMIIHIALIAIFIATAIGSVIFVRHHFNKKEDK